MVGQTSNLQGTWEYSINSNEIFRVVINLSPDNPGFYDGDYYKIDTSGTIESIIYESNYSANGIGFGNAFSVSTDNGTLYSGLITDNTYNYQLGIDERNYKPGRVVIKILPQDLLCNPCNMRAEWKVYHMRGLKNPEEPRDFNIPTDIILTKVD